MNASDHDANDSASVIQETENLHMHALNVAKLPALNTSATVL